MMGEMSTAWEKLYTFMDIKQPLWKLEHGYPTIAGGYVAGEVPVEFKGKLKGVFSWPFSIDLPREVEVNHGNFSTYPLPASYMFNRSWGRFMYKIFAKVTRGRFGGVHM